MTDQNLKNNNLVNPNNVIIDSIKKMPEEVAKQLNQCILYRNKLIEESNNNINKCNDNIRNNNNVRIQKYSESIDVYNTLLKNGNLNPEDREKLEKRMDTLQSNFKSAITIANNDEEKIKQEIIHKKQLEEQNLKDFYKKVNFGIATATIVTIAYSNRDKIIPIVKNGINYLSKIKLPIKL